MKKFISIILIITSIVHSINAQSYSADIELILAKAGKNRVELEKFLSYCKQTNDKLKWEAGYFIIKNMDIHYSENYYWKNEHGQKVEFDEQNYPNFSAAIKGFNELFSRSKLTAVIQKRYDTNYIKSNLLIDNLEKAFEAWKTPLCKHLTFDEFCEYILPYRNITEKQENWRSSYYATFSPKNKAMMQNKNIRNAANLLNDKLTGYFTSSFSYEDKKNPTSYLSPSQMLFRKRGHCEDMVNFTLFAFKSQGIPCRIDFVPYHGTSTGRHYWNATIDENHQLLPFQGSKNSVEEFTLTREPSKVISITYSKQANTLASIIPINEIPNNYLRNCNYKDVTDQYWRTIDLECTLSEQFSDKIAYVGVLNGLQWRPTFWGFIKNNKVVFPKMACGVVYLPMVYRNNKLIPAGYPVLLFNNKETKTLKPNKTKTHNIILEEEENYLKYRNGKKYSLYYWDNKWTLIEQKKASNLSKLQFHNVPCEALLLLVPEYSQHKERPFCITNTGKRIWW